MAIVRLFCYLLDLPADVWLLTYPGSSSDSLHDCLQVFVVAFTCIHPICCSCGLLCDLFSDLYKEMPIIIAILIW